MPRRACLAIGVGTVTEPPKEEKEQALRFAYLDGAVIAARAIGNWALGSDFGVSNVRIVDDGRVRGKENPVTRERVQQAVDELFPKGADIVDHLILAFCGHGLTDANIGSISWLFTDSLLEKYRVVVDRFTAELLLHRVQRITLISDACRQAPNDIELLRLDTVRGIVVQGTQVDSPKFDRFVACQDGQLGFMVAEPNSANPGKCVFSGVIADVLWGKESAAISNGIITTATFGTCVRARTEARAKDYHLPKLNPQCWGDPEPAVLYDDKKPPQGQAALQPWPAAGSASVMGTATVTSFTKEEANQTLDLVRKDPKIRTSVLGPGFGLNLPERGNSLEPLAIPGSSKGMVREIFTFQRSKASKTTRGRRKAEAMVRRLEVNAVTEERKRAAKKFQEGLAQVKPSASRDGANLIVSGSAARLWSRKPVQERKGPSGQLAFRIAGDQQGTPVLIELDAGSFTPMVPYRDLYAVVTKSAVGDVLQAYGWYKSRPSFDAALKAIADFAAGRIGPDDIDQLAARLRMNKHADPVLGVISAYLYRTIADFDSIRRMAYFYVQHGQPVPFDIALLGGMQVTQLANGAPRLHVPAVTARQPRAGSKLPAYVTGATRAALASIGGRCPWLGLGWDYVSLPRPEWAALVDGLADHAREIRRSGFTVLPKETGLALAKSWKLRAR